MFVRVQYACFFLFFTVCSSVVAQWAHAVYLGVCIDFPTHTYIHRAQGGEPLRSWFRCPSLTCSVQDFLQDVARKPVPDSSVSLFFRLPSLPPCLFVFCERGRERRGGTVRESERKSASNLKCSLAVLLWVLTPLCVEAGRQVPL